MWSGPVPQFRRLFRPSIAYRLCLVADGTADAMVSSREIWEWDLAAGALIAAEAGATVTDASGHPLRFNAERPLAAGVLAAGPTLHAALRARIRPS